MIRRRRMPSCALVLSIQAALVLTTVLIVRTASAHEFTIETLMNGFVKIEPSEIHLVVRVPLHVLRSVKFPVSGREIDLIAADIAIQKALSQLGNEITIWENNRPLVVSAAIGRLSLPSDRSFERYTDAVAHVARPVAPGTSTYVDQGYLDGPPHVSDRLAKVPIHDPDGGRAGV